MTALLKKLFDFVDMAIHPDGKPTVIGVFDGHHECVEAIGALRYAYPRIVVHSPIPSHEIESALDKGPSLVRWFTLAGALFGGIGGFALAAWASLQWNLETGGKPIISVPPFLIITFECTILFGAVATLIGFLHSSRLPQPTMSAAYMADFGIDKFGIGVVVDQSKIDEAEKALREAGASEVRRV